MLVTKDSSWLASDGGRDEGVRPRPRTEMPRVSAIVARRWPREPVIPAMRRSIFSDGDRVICACFVLGCSGCSIGLGGDKVSCLVSHSRQAAIVIYSTFS